MQELARLEDERALLGLLDRIEEGDERAMASLYRIFNRRIFAYAMNRLGHRAEAEEVVNDTLMEVWKHPGRFRGESRFSTWLLGIARHKALDKLRGRQPEHEQIDDMVEHLPGNALDGLQAMECREQRHMLRHCMERLPDDQRECLHLVLLEGLPLREVAEVQACPENTVKTRLFHARQKMKTCLSRSLAGRA